MRHLHLAGRDGALQLGIVVGERPQRQRQLADGLGDRDLLGDLGSRLERHRGDGLGDLVARLVARIEALVDGEDADVADDGLGGAQRRTVAAAGHFLGEDEIDPVAREDEAGDAAGRGHGHRHGAHARAQSRGEEAALAGANDGALGQRLAGADLVADDGADQGLRVAAGFAARVISGLDEALGPGLVAERLGVDDRADRQGARRDEDFGTGGNHRAACASGAEAPENMFFAMTAVTAAIRSAPTSSTIFLTSMARIASPHGTEKVSALSINQTG